MLMVSAISQVNIYSKNDCSKASLFKNIGDGSSCADLSTAKGVGLDCPPETGSDGSLATAATSTQDPTTVQVRPLPPITTSQESLTQSQPLTGPYASGSSAMASSNMPQILSQDLLETSRPSSPSTWFNTSTPSEMPHAQSPLTRASTSTDSSALQAKTSSTSRSDSHHNASDTPASSSSHNLSVNGEIIVGTVIPGLAILVAIIIGIDQRRRMRRGQGNVVHVFLDGTRRFSRQRPSPAGNLRRTWPGYCILEQDVIARRGRYAMSIRFRITQSLDCIPSVNRLGLRTLFPYQAAIFERVSFVHEG